ncbi:MAG TPA: DUF1801 domain-containing protein [Daejeonella sp.]|nr:DUF1801 domain-containing protein [Daejeonella sp.]
MKLRETILKNIPTGFEEVMSYGMIGYVVPHHIYPAGYHCTPQLPLPFVNIASQKNFIALYHMALYASPQLHAWFTEQYPLHSRQKLDMGKSCIRFKKLEEIPYDLIGQLIQKVSVDAWIRQYETLKDTRKS